jgi:hypothetical protein
MTMSFGGKVALVTGAGSGMGLATAKAFAEAGAAVALADVNEEAARSAADELVRAGRKVIAVRCDVTDDAQVAAMVERTVSAFGRLDAVDNNAGVQSPAVELADADLGEFDRVNAINLRGVFSCMKHELRQMHEQGEGAPGQAPRPREYRGNCPPGCENGAEPRPAPGVRHCHRRPCPGGRRERPRPTSRQLRERSLSRASGRWSWRTPGLGSPINARTDAVCLSETGENFRQSDSPPKTASRSQARA